MHMQGHIHRRFGLHHACLFENDFCVCVFKKLHLSILMHNFANQEIEKIFMLFRTAIKEGGKRKGDT